MGLFDLFRSKSKAEKLGHLKSLLAMAMADSKISEEEKVVIAAICKREGINADDMRKCLDQDIIYPTDISTRRKYLSDMLVVMIADGEIDENELLFFRITARAMGMQNEAEILINSAEQAINK